LDLPHPQSFYPELSDPALRVIAVALLDVRYTTLREMNSPYDDNYTREATVFGRQKNRLIDLAKSGHHPWLSLRHAGMDVTFNIGQVPCRFFTDDPRNPEKNGFFRRNTVDDLFAPDDRDPVMWRFVVERAYADDDEDRVYFIGFNVFQEPVAEWTFGARPSSLHAADDRVPPPAHIGPAEVGVLDDEATGTGAKLNSGNDG
jgi:hypothetical protein